MMKPMNACFKYGLFARFTDLVFDLLASLFDHLFYPCRMDSAVKNELFKRYPCDLAANGIKA